MRRATPQLALARKAASKRLDLGLKYMFASHSLLSTICIVVLLLGVWTPTALYQGKTHKTLLYTDEVPRMSAHSSVV